MVRFLSSVALLIAAVSTANGFSSVERRGFLSKVGSTIAGAAVIAANAEQAQATAAKTGSSSPFTGDYEDPNHPGCLRQVKVVGAPLRADGTRSAYPLIEVVGYDGKKGEAAMCSDRPTRDDLWKIQGKMKSNSEAMIDFSPKGGPSNLLGTWDGSGIVFPDGNKWTKIAGGTPLRRPEDMSTLKSSS
jgi:hypothetical protein